MRSLADLAERGEINERVFGKQKIYFPLQDRYEKLTPDELDAMDKTIQATKTRLGEVKRDVQQLKSQVGSVKAEPSTKDAETEVAALRPRVAELEERLKPLRSGAEQFTEVQRDAVQLRYKNCVRAWRKRKRIADDVIGQILESYPKNKRALMEDIGIETDEEYKVDLKTFPRE